MWKRPWVMTQEWHDILFLHWPVASKEIRAYIPMELDLDIYNNCAWIGLVYFRVKKNRPRLIPPVPGVSSFLELNVRTYVTYKGRCGVYFFSLDADNPLIVKLTTLGNFLPYRDSKMSCNRSKNAFTIYSETIDDKIITERLVSSFEPNREVIESNPFECWLTERYHLWTKTKGRLFRVDIRHSPWKLQNVTCDIHANTMASFIRCNYQVNSPIAHYSKMKKALFYPPVMENMESK